MSCWEHEKEEPYRGIPIWKMLSEDGYRVDFGTMRSKLVNTVDEAKELIDFYLSPDKWKE